MFNKLGFMCFAYLFGFGVFVFVFVGFFELGVSGVARIKYHPQINDRSRYTHRIMKSPVLFRWVMYSTQISSKHDMLYSKKGDAGKDSFGCISLLIEH